ncbi:hypothetical protein FRC01_001469 [Tulasnella sp. 417]|nr:hypothetical protein FRC01_001469 [Tulasnella sp. 417]
MNTSDIDNILHLASTLLEDERIRDLLGQLSPTFDPLSALPDPLESEIAAPPPSALVNAVSPALTEEEAAHVDNLLFWGVDSPVLPEDIQESLLAMTGSPLDPGPPPLTTPSTLLTTSSASPLPISSALFSPVTAYTAPSASPPAFKRPFSLTDPPDSQPHDPTPGPSTPRPTKRPRISVPGESFFELDTSVAPLNPTTQPTGQQMAKPREPRRDYSACKCEGGPTSKPARHWPICPYNPDRIKGNDDKPFACDAPGCDIRFGRKDNKKRHIEEYHPEISI